MAPILSSSIRQAEAELNSAVAAGDKAEAARLLSILRSLVRAAVTA
jgi:hypothetical protein